MELKDFAVNGTEKYWTVEDKRGDGHTVSRNQKFWTLTVHDPNCRFARKGNHGTPIQAYFGSDGLINLAQRGLNAPVGPYNGTVWQGCKTCGTGTQPNANWKARAQAVIDGEKAAKARQREEREAEGIIQAAKDAFEKAQRDAAIAWQEEHEYQLAAVRMAAAAEWIVANPEQARLIGR